MIDDIPTSGTPNIIPLETLTQHLSCDPEEFVFHHVHEDPQIPQEHPGSW